ncbi:HisA/HisF-related TIM barrel protein [Aestuariivita boseongensis]|uniref:1-(5-phosphoribosyl)-5-[(5- phosphoribosylamino)methylideneamino]imidazole-4- carboxamide isomerase n=1 Tax=Aestuariivita boseongensis TaxID=1470562 RepID=UPI0006826C90|nr:1-(5-phosphoribosyl)-5-[(5-phosphoribosylamino)methylideneamino] imidazole-4-carboxamide isomerase [Aestuariivita boseongensis]
MIVYPTIELQQGRCVSLKRGRLNEPVIWHVDPIETARKFREAGAQWMHVTDFDGVVGGNANNTLLEDIIRTAGIPVQLGGGFRTRESVVRWIDKGAGRIVIGTLATQNPDLVKELARSFPDQIVLAVDVWQGKVMSEGWRAATAFTPEDFIAAFSDTPLAGVIITDIDSDMEEVEAQLGMVSGLAAQVRVPVMVRGVINTVDDIARAKYIPNISGVLVGRALFSRDLDLAEALAVAQPRPEPIADFQ